MAGSPARLRATREIIIYIFTASGQIYKYAFWSERMIRGKERTRRVDGYERVSEDRS
jgi:hypothetical protein